MIPVTGFIGGAYSLPGKDISTQRCVNLYTEVVPSGDKSAAVLLGTPGFSQFATYIYNLAGQPVRQGGIYVTTTGLLVVARGAKLYAYTGIVDEDLVPYTGSYGEFDTLDDASEPGYGPIAIGDNGIILLVSSGDAVYKYPLDNLTSGGEITAWSFGGFTHVQYLAARFLVNTPNDSSDDPTQNKYRVSPLDWDGTFADWDSEAYASADQSPDPLLGFIVRGRDIMLFSRQSTEFAYPSDALPMPMVSNPSAGSSVGCGAKYSIAKTGDTVFWLGAGADGFNKIFKCSAFSPEVISNPAIEQEIASYAGTDDALGFAYQNAGHSFYIITFQTGNKSWQYDLTTGLWNELSSTNGDGDQERIRYLGMAAFEGRIIALDRVDNGPVLVSVNTYTEHGYSILRVRTSPHSYSNLNRVFFSKFQLDIEAGVGLTTGQGSEPLVRLRWSNDAGHTWGNFQLRSFGRIGEYAKRVTWNRLGQSRSRVWEISTSEPVPVRILGAWVDAEEGMN